MAKEQSDSQYGDFTQEQLTKVPVEQLNITPTSGGSVVEIGALMSPNYTRRKLGWSIDSTGNAEFNDGTFRGDVIIGGISRTIDNSENVQDALDYLHANGGGTLYLKSGTYSISKSLTGYSSVALVGISPAATILDFGSTNHTLSYAGTNAYTTGTITNISGGVNVTGSGTLWLANVHAGQTLFLGTR